MMFPNTTCIGWRVFFDSDIDADNMFPNTTCIGWSDTLKKFIKNAIMFPNTTCIGWSHTPNKSKGYRKFPNTTCIGWRHLIHIVYGELWSFQTLRVSVEEKLRVDFVRENKVSKHYVYRLKDHNRETWMLDFLCFQTLRVSVEERFVKRIKKSF